MSSYHKILEGAIGIKTGFTGKAGYCFVGALRHDGKNFVSVVLGSGFHQHVLQLLQPYHYDFLTLKSILNPLNNTDLL